MFESGRTENFRRAEEGSRGGGGVINDRPAGRIIFSGDAKGEEYGGMDFWKASGRRRDYKNFRSVEGRRPTRRAKSRNCRGCWRFANRRERSRYSHAIVSQRERGGRARSRIDEEGGEKKVKPRKVRSRFPRRCSSFSPSSFSFRTEQS